MDDTLERAFFDEILSLEKQAGVVSRLASLTSKLPKFMQRWARPSSVSRALTSLPASIEEGAVGMAHTLNPITALPKGWASLTPHKSEALKAGISQSLQETPGWWGRNFGRQSMAHMLDRPTSLRAAASEGPKGVAEELSRRGWTGKGAITKYVPLGTKSQMVGFGAMPIQGVVKAYDKDPTPTGEGGFAEKGLETLGGAYGWIAGAPLGLMGSMGAYFGSEALGRRAGRVIDRLRGGANPMTAVTAPSPTEAAEQLATIQRYYG